MCGILAILCKDESMPEKIWKESSGNLERRGPDANSRVILALPDGFTLHLHSWVLHMRGTEPQSQPYTNENGDALQWNGDIFGGIEVEENECDTVILGERLAKCTTDNEICHVFSVLEGPWSFVFYHKTTGKVWFGRDYFGRRSLLWQKNMRDELVLTSVAKRMKKEGDGHWSELPADGIYNMSVGPEGFSLSLYPWSSITELGSTKVDVVKSFSNEEELFHKSFDDLTIGPVLNTPIQLFRVEDFYPNISFSEENSNLKTLVEICNQKDMWGTVNSFIEILENAVQKRVFKVPKKCPDSASVGVLFSGGIDCTVLALLADKFIPKAESIDLLNVAFETNQKRPVSCKKFEVPDRVTGRLSLLELQELCPERKWNFVEINVRLEELKSKREDRIADLTYPLVSVLDDSIGCAVWFACRGEGVVSKNEDSNPYKCNAKVLLCGMGADEQLAGYSRHRSAFESGNFEGLAKEIKMEVERISFRNLGRDNRIVADHGRDARMPYLDERVVSFLNQTPIYLKADLTFKRGIGEKLLLRAAAYKLGLRNCAILPKRAIQFGSRIAKAECRKEKANDVCSRLFINDISTS